MGLLTKLRSAVGSDSGEQTYKYECQACHNRFESSTAKMSEVTCPDCGDHNVRDVKTL